jgi:hypothetical protein
MNSITSTSFYFNIMLLGVVLDSRTTTVGHRSGSRAIYCDVRVVEILTDQQTSSKLAACRPKGMCQRDTPKHIFIPSYLIHRSNFNHSCVCTAACTALGG